MVVNSPSICPSNSPSIHPSVHSSVHPSFLPSLHPSMSLIFVVKGSSQDAHDWAIGLPAIHTNNKVIIFYGIQKNKIITRFRNHYPLFPCSHLLRSISPFPMYTPPPILVSLALEVYLQFHYKAPYLHCYKSTKYHSIVTQIGLLRVLNIRLDD